MSDRSLFNCVDCGTPLNAPTECRCNPCKTKPRQTAEVKGNTMTDKPSIPTTDAEAKKHFKDSAIGGYTLNDWREFIGTLSGVNTKKMKPLELYHLKEKLNNALRKNTETEGVKYPTAEEMSTEFPRLLNRVKYLMAENTEKADMIATLQDAYITQGCRINHLDRKLNKLLGHGSVDYPEPTEQEQRILTMLDRMTQKVDIMIKTDRYSNTVEPSSVASDALFQTAKSGATTLSVAGEDGVFNEVQYVRGGIIGWFKRKFNRDNAPTTILWILILGMLPLMFTPVARIYEWLPKLLSYIGGLF